MEKQRAIDFLLNFFAGFEESSLYEDYLDSVGVTDEEYEEAWAALRAGPVPVTGQLTGKENPFANDPIVIAIRDDKWTGVLRDSYDNDPVYYEHHETEPDENLCYCDGFVPRGEHYILVFITKQGEVNIDMGYHKDEIPAHAFVMGD